MGQRLLGHKWQLNHKDSGSSEPPRPHPSFQHFLRVSLQACTNPVRPFCPGWHWTTTQLRKVSDTQLWQVPSSPPRTHQHWAHPSWSRAQRIVSLWRGQTYPGDPPRTSPSAMQLCLWLLSQRAHRTGHPDPTAAADRASPVLAALTGFRHGHREGGSARCLWRHQGSIWAAWRRVTDIQGPLHRPRSLPPPGQEDSHGHTFSGDLTQPDQPQLHLTLVTGHLT